MAGAPPRHTEAAGSIPGLGPSVSVATDRHFSVSAFPLSLQNQQIKALKNHKKDDNTNYASRQEAKPQLASHAGVVSNDTADAARTVRGGSSDGSEQRAPDGPARAGQASGRPSFRTEGRAVTPRSWTSTWIRATSGDPEPTRVKTLEGTIGRYLFLLRSPRLSQSQNV